MKVTSRFFVVIILLLSVNGCHHYKVGTVKTISAGYIVEKDKAHDYLIVHMDEEIWNLQNARSENNQLLGTKHAITSNHTAFIKNQNTSKNIYRYKKSNYSPKNEVHIYVNKAIIDEGGSVVINVADITNVEVYDEAVGANITTNVVAPISVAGAGFYVFFIIMIYIYGF